MKELQLELPRNPDERPGWVVVVQDTPPYKVNVSIVVCKECNVFKDKIKDLEEENANLKQLTDRLRREISLVDLKKNTKVSRDETKSDDGSSVDAREEDENIVEVIDLEILKKKFDELGASISKIKGSNTNSKELAVIYNNISPEIEKIEQNVGKLEQKIEQMTETSSSQQAMMREMRAEITDLQCEISELKVTNSDLVRDFKKEKKEALTSLEETKNRHAASLYKQVKELQQQMKEKCRLSAGARDTLRAHLDKLQFLKKDKAININEGYEKMVSQTLTAAEKHVSWLSLQLQQKDEYIRVNNLKRADNEFSGKLMEIVGGSVLSGTLQLKQFGVSRLEKPRTNWVKYPTFAYDAPLKIDDERMNAMERMWNLISSPRHPSLKQLIDSLRMFLLKQEAVARIAIAGTPLALPKKITRKAMTEKKMTTGMSAKTMKSIKKFLKLYKIDILPTMKKLSPFFYCDVDISPKAIEVGAEMLCTEKVGVKLSKVTYLKMKNVKQEVTKMVKYHASKKRLLMGGHFSENIWVKLGVASDGKSTKVILQIVNVKKSNKLLPKLVGVFNAADTYLNLKTLFSPNLRVQTEKLAASGICIGKQGLGFPKNVPVKMFSVCEYDSMCNLVGHEGRSSSHPCLWCLVPQKGLRDMKGHPHTPFLLDKNKLKRYSHCAYKQRSFDLESRSEANGMVDDPIIDIPRDQLVPCPRRILTRLGLLFFNLLFQKCKKLDHISRFKDCKKCYELVEFETEVQSCTSKLLAAVHDQSISNDVVSLITKQNNKAVEGEAVNRCDFLKCTEEGQIKTTKLECQSCCKWFHKSCVSVIQDYKNLNNRPYTCPVCEKTVLDLPHLLTLVLQKKSEENTKVDSLKEKLQVAEVNRTMVASKHAVVGTLEQKLSNIVTEELKIPMSTFLSKELTWDGLKKIMSSYEKLVSVLYLHHDLKSTFMKLFEEFAAIHKILGLTRFLSDSEIDSLSRACWRLGSWYPLKFKQSVTLEFHILVFHVPEFLKQWHGIGMFADSEKVAVHESFQNDLRSSASTSTSEQLKFSYAKNLVKSLIPVRKRKANTSESGPPAKKVNSEHSVVSDNSGTSEQVSKSPQDSQKKPQAKEVASTFIVSTANAST